MNRRGFLGFLAALPVLPLLGKIRGGKTPGAPKVTNNTKTLFHTLNDADMAAALKRDQDRMNVKATLQWRRLCQANGEVWRIDARPARAGDTAEFVDRVFRDVMGDFHRRMAEFHRA